MPTSSKLILTAAAAITALLTACATPDRNPYYEYSSKYPGQSSPGQTSGELDTQAPTVSYASSQSSHNGYVTEAGYPAPAGSVFADSPTTAAGYPQASTGQVYGASQTYGQSYGYVQQAGAIVPSAANTISDSAMIETGGQNAGAAGHLMQPDMNYGFGSATHSGAQSAALPAQPAPLTVEPLASQTYAAAPYSYKAPVTQIAAAPAMPAPIASAPITTGMDFGSAQSFNQGIRYIVQEDDTVYSLSRKTCSSVDQIKAMNGLDDSFLIKAGGTLQLPASNC